MKRNEIPPCLVKPFDSTNPLLKVWLLNSKFHQLKNMHLQLFFGSLANFLCTAESSFLLITSSTTRRRGSTWRIFHRQWSPRDYQKAGWEWFWRFGEDWVEKPVSSLCKLERRREAEEKEARTWWISGCTPNKGCRSRSNMFIWSASNRLVSFPTV
jgi:hypothetical protein